MRELNARTYPLHYKLLFWLWLFSVLWSYRIPVHVITRVLSDTIRTGVQVHFRDGLSTTFLNLLLDGVGLTKASL